MALTVLLTSVPLAHANNTLNGIQLFPEDHILNVPIDTLPVDPKSYDYIKSNGGASGNLFAAFGNGYSGLGYDVVDETVVKTQVIFQICPL